SAESRKTAALVFEGPGLAAFDWHDRTHLVLLFRQVGMADGFRFYRRLLDVESQQFGTLSLREPVADAAAWEVAHGLAPRDSGLIDLWLKTRSANPELRAAAKEWIEAKIREVEKKDK